MLLVRYRRTARLDGANKQATQPLGAIIDHLWVGWTEASTIEKDGRGEDGGIHSNA